MPDLDEVGIAAAPHLDALAQTLTLLNILESGRALKVIAPRDEDATGPFIAFGDIFS